MKNEENPPPAQWKSAAGWQSSDARLISTPSKIDEKDRGQPRAKNGRQNRYLHFHLVKVWPTHKLSWQTAGPSGAGLTEKKKQHGTKESPNFKPN